MSVNPRDRYVSVDTRSGSKIPTNVLSDQSNTPSISKYFRGTKANPTPFESTPTISKHLQAKYNNFSNQPINIPDKIPFPKLGSKREKEQRNEYVQQMTASEYNPPANKIKKQHWATADEQAVNTPAKRIRPSVIHLIGFVENVLNWYTKLKNAEIRVLYNVIGKFVRVTDGNHDLEKYVFIRGNNGCVLECGYFETDCTLPHMIKGQTVACLGHITSEQKFSVYHLYVLDNITNLDIQRAICMSQRMVVEYSNIKSY